MLCCDFEEAENIRKQRYSMYCLNDINYHVDDVLKTTQCGGRSARSPDVYWMLQDHLWE